MSPALLRLAPCALLAGALLAAPASARDGVNAAIIGGAAAGVLGGVAAGALMNGAQPAPPPPPGYYAPPPPRPVYVEPREVEYARPRRAGPICHFERRRVWLGDGEFTYKRVEVCE